MSCHHVLGAVGGRWWDDHGASKGRCNCLGSQRIEILKIMEILQQTCWQLFCCFVVPESYAWRTYLASNTISASGGALCNSELQQDCIFLWQTVDDSFDDVFLCGYCLMELRHHHSRQFHFLSEFFRIISDWSTFVFNQCFRMPLPVDVVASCCFTQGAGTSVNNSEMPLSPASNLLLLPCLIHWGPCRRFRSRTNVATGCQSHLLLWCFLLSFGALNGLSWCLMPECLKWCLLGCFQLKVELNIKSLGNDGINCEDLRKSFPPIHQHPTSTNPQPTIAPRFRGEGIHGNWTARDPGAAGQPGSRVWRLQFALSWRWVEWVESGNDGKIPVESGNSIWSLDM